MCLLKKINYYFFELFFNNNFIFELISFFLLQKKILFNKNIFIINFKNATLLILH